MIFLRSIYGMTLTDEIRSCWQGRKEIFSLHYCFQNDAGVHPASYTMGTGVSYPGVRRPERETDKSSPSGPEVKNARGYTSTLSHTSS
jgi:hypothetical protein